jgi:hypothetical protein
MEKNIERLGQEYKNLCVEYEPKYKALKEKENMIPKKFLKKEEKKLNKEFGKKLKDIIKGKEKSNGRIYKKDLKK